MSHLPQIKIPATYMRGGTSKGVFLLQASLPAAARADPALRDRLLLRLIGSPDPYGAQIDGLGGGTSSTSKVVLVARSARPGHDVDYLFGAVAIGQPLIDWSGNCGNLSAAVGPFAIAQGLVPAPRDGLATVRLWQANIGKTIVAHVPMQRGAVCEAGDFMLDGVAFASAAIELEFLDPGGGKAGAAGPLLPTGRAVDVLTAPDGARVEATLINAGNPTVFVDAQAIGLTGREMQPDVNGTPALLDRLEALRAQAAVVMGLAGSTAEATRDRPATPKLPEGCPKRTRPSGGAAGSRRCTSVPGMLAAAAMATPPVPVMAWCSRPIERMRASRSISAALTRRPSAAR